MADEDAISKRVASVLETHLERDKASCYLYVFRYFVFIMNRVTETKDKFSSPIVAPVCFTPS